MEIIIIASGSYARMHVGLRELQQFGVYFKCWQHHKKSEFHFLFSSGDLCCFLYLTALKCSHKTLQQMWNVYFYGSRTHWGLQIVRKKRFLSMEVKHMLTHSWNKVYVFCSCVLSFKALWFVPQHVTVFKLVYLSIMYDEWCFQESGCWHIKGEMNVNTTRSAQ